MIVIQLRVVEEPVEDRRRRPAFELYPLRGHRLSTPPASANSALDEVVCGGVAIDVFHADQARRLLEELDAYVEAINETGIGRGFVGNLQLILERQLYLSLARLYEPYSSRNPTRSIGAAIHFIRSHACELQIVDRRRLIDFLSGQGESGSTLNGLQGERLSLAFVQHVDDHLPKADSSSARPLDQALANLKRVRDKAIAHHDRVDRASLIVPGWSKLVELIDHAREFVVLVARSYLNVGHDLGRDASRAASSLRKLLKRAGLTRRSAPGN